MRASFVAATIALFTSAAVAAPLDKRGGFWHEGKWVDDGYWAWSQGDRKEAFKPWANGKPDYAPSNDEDSWQKESDDNVKAAKSSGGKSGQATYFHQNGNAGACGAVHSDSDYIVALPYASSPMSNCGSTVSISRGGKSISAKAVDICPSCDPSHIDLSVGAFQALGNLGEGVIPITWSLN